MKLQKFFLEKQNSYIIKKKKMALLSLYYEKVDILNNLTKENLKAK